MKHSEKKRRSSRAVLFLFHLFIFLALGAFLLFGACPFRLLFRIPCPCCGLTRAWKAALQLDFLSAFYYHPLFWFIPPLKLYTAHRSVLPRRLSKKAENILLITAAVLILAVYLIRIYLFQIRI